MLIHIMILKFTHGIKNNHHNFVQIILAPTHKIGHLLHLCCRNDTLIFKKYTRICASFYVLIDENIAKIINSYSKTNLVWPSTQKAMRKIGINRSLFI